MNPIAFFPQTQSVPPFLQGIIGTPIGASPLGASPFGIGSTLIPQQSLASQLGGSLQGGFPPGFLIGGPTNQFGMPVGGAPLSFGPLGQSQLGLAGLGASPFGASPLGASPFGSQFSLGASPLAGLGGNPLAGLGGNPLAGLGGNPLAGLGGNPLAGLGGNPLAGLGGNPLAGLGGNPLAGLGGNPLGASPLAALGATSPLAGLGATGLNPTSLQQPQTSQLPTGGGLGQMGQLIQLVLQMLMLMLTLLLGNRAPQPAFDRGEPTPSVGGGGNNANVSGGNTPDSLGATRPQVANVAPPTVSNPGAINNSGNGQLDASLQKIAATPDGAKLIAEAQRRGVTIRVGDPGAASGSRDQVGGGACNCDQCTSVAKDGTTVVNGVTITRGGKTEIIVRDPNNIKTIVHELVHATSTEDGNSKLEETAADSVGYRVLAQIEGRGLSGSELSAIRNKASYYPNLGSFNNIENTLARLGIQAFA